RGRGMLGMVLGVGGALGMVMMLLFMARASTWIYIQDYVESGTDLYIVRNGGVLVGRLPGETPGTLRDARHRLAQIRAMPEVHAALGILAWQLERTHDGPRRGQPSELVGVVGV